MTRFLFSLATSGITLSGMWLAGDRKATAWWLGLLAQAFWFVFILMFGAWGLLPLNVALVGVYSRNLAKWRRESRALASGDIHLGKED